MRTPVACLLFAVGAHARPTSDKPSTLLPATHNATQSTMKCGSPEELSANPLLMQGNSGQMPDEQAMLERLVKNATTYCEVGFNGGHSALFALRTNPQLHVVSFDLGETDAKGAPKTLVVIHRHAGYKLLLRMLARRLGPGAVRGFPAAKTAAERADEALMSNSLLLL